MVDAQNFITHQIEHKVVNEMSNYYDSGSTYDHVLSNVVGFETNTTLGKSIGTFTIKLANFKNSANEFDYKDVFGYNDIITIRIGRNNTNTLVMKGFLESWKYQVNAKTSLLTLNGVDISRKLLDTIHVGVANSGGTTPVSTVISDVIQTTNGKIKEVVTTNNLSTTTYTGYGPLRFNYKQVWEIIAMLSVNDYTQQGNFHFWIDEDYDLHWEPVSFDTYDTQLTEGINVLDYKVEKSKVGVKNFIIIDAGEDLNGHAIYTYAIDYTAVAENNGEFISDFVKWPEIAEGKRVGKDTDHPFGNPNDYSGGNSQFRNDVRDAARLASKEFFGKLNKPLWKAEVRLLGTTGYNLNNLVYLNIPKLGSNWNESILGEDGNNYTGKKFRVFGITQSFNQSGWTTKLTLKSDVEVLEAWYSASS